MTTPTTPVSVAITPEHHAQAVEVAVARAKQEMFEACVKAACWMCNGESNLMRNAAPISGIQTLVHYDRDSTIWKVCRAAPIRITFPERSAAMDAKV